MEASGAEMTFYPHMVTFSTGNGSIYVTLPLLSEG